MTFLEIALNCIARGWYVFPCFGKQPGTKNGWHDASNDETQVRSWWTATPKANVAIACKPSGLIVVDLDHGLTDEESLKRWMGELPKTYAVHTGRRTEYAVHLYYSGAMKDNTGWERGGCTGEFKSAGGYVMAAGSIHPDSHQPYEVLWDLPVLPAPSNLTEVVKPVQSRQATGKDAEPVEGSRNIYLTSFAGKLRNLGMSADELEAALLAHNEQRCQPPLPEDEVQKIARSVARYDVPEQYGEVHIGPHKTEENPEEQPVKTGDGRLWLCPKDATALFSTRKQMDEAKPLGFFIEGFLPDDGVTAIGAPVAQRKSLIAQNIARSLLTGEPLFGHFRVVRQPTRVLYLVPELTRTSLKKRLAGLGLMEYVGTKLLCRTLDEEGKLWLDDPALRPYLPGSVAILDTAIRFMAGNEKESEDMQRFSEQIFGMLRDGCQSVVLLHHARKDGKDGGALTLDACMRGSGELAAFLTTCWATRLNGAEGEDEYDSPSILKNVKKRDIETKDFEVMSNRQTGVLTMVPDSLGNAKLKTKKRADKDGKDDRRMDFLRKNPELSDREAAEALKRLKMGRGKDWVHRKRKDLEMEDADIDYNVGGIRVTHEKAQ
ncbi:MAG TPA: bifunctional DNA primase/polymerase [Terriglobales bacterium]